VALSGILYLTLTRKYTATALVLIENSPHLMQIESVVQGVSDSTRELKTQAEVLTSPALAARVIDRLNLQADPEINPALAGGTDRSWLPDVSRLVEPVWSDVSRLVEPVWRAVSALPLQSGHASVEVNNTGGLLVDRFRSLLSTSVKERSSI